MDSVFMTVVLVMAGPMVMMLGVVFGTTSVDFCGDPSWMFPSLSANTIGMSNMFVFDRSGVGGDFMVFIGDTLAMGVDGPEMAPELRTIVNLVGLNDWCCVIVVCGDGCLISGEGADVEDMPGGFGITETTGLGDDFRVTNFCVDPDGFN